MGRQEEQAQEQTQLLRKGDLWAINPVSSPFIEYLWAVFQKFNQKIPSENRLQFPRRVFCLNEAFIKFLFSLSNFLTSIFCFLCHLSIISFRLPIYPLFSVDCVVRFMKVLLLWCLWYQGNIGIAEWTGKHSLLTFLRVYKKVGVTSSLNIWAFLCRNFLNY